MRKIKALLAWKSG